MPRLTVKELLALKGKKQLTEVIIRPSITAFENHFGYRMSIGTIIFVELPYPFEKDGTL